MKLTARFVLVEFANVQILLSFEGAQADAAIAVQFPVLVAILVGLRGVTFLALLCWRWIALKFVIAKEMFCKIC